MANARCAVEPDIKCMKTVGECDAYLGGYFQNNFVELSVLWLSFRLCYMFNTYPLVIFFSVLYGMHIVS